MILDIVNLLRNIQPPPVDWVIPDFIPRGTIVALAGDPGVGKSYLAYYIALHLALGLPIFGRPTKRQRVLYFDQENSLPDIQRYLWEQFQGLGIPPPDDLHDWLQIRVGELGGGNWEAVIRAAVADWAPDLTIIDTSSSAFPIPNTATEENLEAARIINILRKIRTTFLVLRHAKLHYDRLGEAAPKRSMRGAKHWHGAVDQVVFHVARAGRPPSGGFRPTALEPDKSRAYGLKEVITIAPKRLDGGGVEVWTKRSES